MYEAGDKVKLKNGCVVTISGKVSSIDMTEGYTTYEMAIISPDMIQEKIN
jgi:hypothetical protein